MSQKGTPQKKGLEEDKSGDSTHPPHSPAKIKRQSSTSEKVVSPAAALAAIAAAAVAAGTSKGGFGKGNGNQGDDNQGDGSKAGASQADASQAGASQAGASQAGASQAGASQGSSSDSDILRRSTYSKFISELGTGLSNLKSRLTGQTSEKPKEMYSWVIKEHRMKPSRFKLPFGTRLEKSFANPRYTAMDITHRDSLLIKDFQCFEVSTHKLSRFSQHFIKRLGICVKFLKLDCYDGYCDSCQDKFCRACPHLFVCDCSNKFDDTIWCAHQHVAYRMNMGAYGSKACLFIEYCYNFTEKRHLRAYVQGPNKMRRIADDMYIEQFEFLRRSMRYHVRLLDTDRPCECPDAKICKLCDACWCRYSCTCDDYWHDRQVCEHIHNVAMLRHPNSDDLYSNFEPSHRIYLNEESVFERERRLSIEQEHELSYYFQLCNIEKHPEHLKWSMYSRAEQRHITVMQQMTATSTCICHKSTTTKALMCTRCKICSSHYVCDCQLWPDHFLCRHMHAVARYEQENIDHAAADAQEYVKNIILEFETEFEEEQNIRKRKPVGPVEETSD